jgi:hypothetical protein
MTKSIYLRFISSIELCYHDLISYSHGRVERMKGTKRPRKASFRGIPRRAYNEKIQVLCRPQSLSEAYGARSYQRVNHLSLGTIY